MTLTNRFSRRSFLILSTAALSTSTLAACKFERDVLRFSGATMGTQYNVVAIPADGSVDETALGAAIQSALAQVNAEMSNWDAGSEISRVNAAPAGQAVQLSPALAQVMQGADQVHRLSEGSFDVTVGALIDTWGFGAAEVQPHIPAEADIDRARAISGQGRVLSLNGTELRKNEAGAEIYLSAIGKGHGVDRVAEAVRSFGITDFMVEIGGDLYASGLNPEGAPWRIGIESPVAGERGLHSVANVSGLGMATSGDYRNFFDAGDQRYSHIIDPTTGRPILHSTVSATVLTGDAMMADAWATAMLVLGADRGLAIAEDQNLAVVFIDRDGDGFTTRASSHYTALQA